MAVTSKRIGYQDCNDAVRPASATYQVSSNKIPAEIPAANAVRPHDGCETCPVCIPPDHQAPKPETLRAFGLWEAPSPIPGGQGTSWVSGGVVLKPGADLAFQAWHGSVLAGIAEDGFRLARAVPTRDGAWTHGGWSATIMLAGTEPDHVRKPAWREIVEAGRSFHQATSRLPKPAFVARTDSWWSRADQRAWSGDRTNVSPALSPIIARLRAPCMEPGPAQVVHGDLTMNVLLEPGLAPGIIDISPYWRPQSYAEGIILADALCWHGAPALLLDELGVPVAAVARALLFRALTTQERVDTGVGVDTFDAEVSRYDTAATAIGL